MRVYRYHLAAWWQFFDVSNTEELIQQMFAYIEMQVENPRTPESDFILYQIIHLHINFYKLAFTRSSSYVELSLKEGRKQPKRNNEQCFK